MSHRGTNFESFHDLDPLAEDYPQTEGVMRRLLLEFFDELPFRNVNTAQMSTFSPGGRLSFFWWVNANSIKNCYREAFFIEGGGTLNGCVIWLRLWHRLKGHTKAHIIMPIIGVNEQIGLQPSLLTILKKTRHFFMILTTCRYSSLPNVRPDQNC